ncbi:hypothetical protein RCL1_000566 [Eukaryota sp. TZLM3-RCL]
MRRICIIGGSGKQGTNLLNALTSHQQFRNVEKIRVFCKHSNQQLDQIRQKIGDKLEVFTGDLNSPQHEQDVRHCLEGCDTCVLIQNPTDYNSDLKRGSEMEVQHGKKLIEMCTQLNVKNFVYSSWAACCAAKELDVPHFHSKCQLEQWLQSKKSSFDSFSICRPTWFMENIIYDEDIKRSLQQDHVLRLPLRANTKLPCCSITDVGRVLADCCLDPQKLSHHNNIVEIVSEILTPEEMARQLNCRFEECDRSKLEPAFNRMYEFLQREPIRPDVNFCRECFGQFLSFQQFAQRSNLVSKETTRPQESRAEAGISRT